MAAGGAGSPGASAGAGESTPQQKSHGPPVPKHRRSPEGREPKRPAASIPAASLGEAAVPADGKGLSLEECCLAALKAQGSPALSVKLHDGVLKGGYICATRRIEVEYPEGAARDDGQPLPATAVLKGVDARCADHSVALALKLYHREWHYYEVMRPLVSEVLRSPAYLGTLLSSDGSGEKQGVLLEDLCVPGAVLHPKLDTAGVLVTAEHCARMHARFWNSPKLEELGVQPHNGSWFNPSWRVDVQEYWSTFKPKWQAQLGDELIALGERVQRHFQWVQDEISKPPRTFVHGDVKPANMFMVPDSAEEDRVPLRWNGMVPTFIDWQYTAVGKGCADLVFFLIEGYTVEACAELEPIVKKSYYESLLRNGVADYTEAQLDRDWQLAAMYFPFYVAMWFGNVADEDLVDASFPKRFVPRCFEAMQRHNCGAILPP